MHERIQVCLVKDVVQLLLSQLDPEGCYMRKSHRLRRREYQNEGPNSAWHADGYDNMVLFSVQNLYEPLLGICHIFQQSPKNTM